MRHALKWLKSMENLGKIHVNRRKLLPRSAREKPPLIITFLLFFQRTARTEVFYPQAITAIAPQISQIVAT